MALHDKLKEVRTRKGLSQELVAEELGISRQAVTKWELGQTKPSARNLQALAELYQISTEELLADTEPKGPNQILQSNLIRTAIAAQAACLYSYTQAVYQLPRADDLNKPIYQAEITIFLVLLLAATTWMTLNHRYEPDKTQRRKNVNLELCYCCIQAFLGLLTIRFGMGLVGLLLIVAVCYIYVAYINPKFMNRRLTR